MDNEKIKRIWKYDEQKLQFAQDNDKNIKRKLISDLIKAKNEIYRSRINIAITLKKQENKLKRQIEILEKELNE